MSRITELRTIRLEKITTLNQNGINPYPIESSYDYAVDSFTDQFESIEQKGTDITLVGRVMSLRPQGKIVFFNINDGTDSIQGMIKDDGVLEYSFDVWNAIVDIGDIIQITGTPTTTKRGEKSLLVSKWTMLAKSLRPLPEKWHGLSDTEERSRKRYLDTLMSSESKNVFYTRSRAISCIRRHLEDEGFIEVETPMLQKLAGGANAETFQTHHNALDYDFHLRISPELYLKRLLVGGFPRVFEIGRCFRNEGIDVTHTPEFTMLEWYEAFSDAKEQKQRVATLLRTIVRSVSDSDTIVFNSHSIDFSKTFKEISYFDLFREYNEFDPSTVDFSFLSSHAQDIGVQVQTGDSFEKILDSIYKKHIRPSLIQPTIIIDYPTAYLPLAKQASDTDDMVDAFQLVVGGIEIVKAFSELNDPQEQRRRFEDQEKNKQAGDSEAQSLDEDFIEALEYGMPPAGGVGIGVDRLIMLLTNTQHIRDVILFPTLKPKK